MQVLGGDWAFVVASRRWLSSENRRKSSITGMRVADLLTQVFKRGILLRHACGQDVSRLGSGPSLNLPEFLFRGSLSMLASAGHAVLATLLLGDGLLLQSATF